MEKKINKNYDACITVQHMQQTPLQTENTQAEIQPFSYILC